MRLIGASSILSTLVNILEIGGIIIFGSFILILVVDLLLAALDNQRQGLFFNRKQQPTKAQTGVTYVEAPNPEPQVAEDGVVYLADQKPEDPFVPETEPVTSVDFDKAVQEQQALEKKFNNEPSKTLFVEDEADDEDISKILDDVTSKALSELKDAEVKDRKVFKAVSDVPVPPVEPLIVTAVPEPEPVVEEPKEDENLKRLEQERLELERKVKELEELRVKDREELLKTMQELKDKEPVVVEVDSKKEDERKYANIARMNARLNSIKRNTSNLNKKKKEAKEAPKMIKTTVVETEINTKSEPAPAAKVEVETQVVEKPKFKKAYYENRLEVLEAELKEAKKELKINNKEYLPLSKVKKSYEKDTEKCNRICVWFHGCFCGYGSICGNAWRLPFKISGGSQYRVRTDCYILWTEFFRSVSV